MGAGKLRLRLFSRRHEGWRRRLLPRVRSQSKHCVPRWDCACECTPECHLRPAAPAERRRLHLRYLSKTARTSVTEAISPRSSSARPSRTSRRSSSLSSIDLVVAELRNLFEHLGGVLLALLGERLDLLDGAFKSFDHVEAYHDSGRSETRVGRGGGGSRPSSASARSRTRGAGMAPGAPGRKALMTGDIRQRRWRQLTPARVVIDC